MKFNELGRSMVEMLGVLAIIGVLSVGAIAGYSKAMMKYKLNKYTEQMNQIISGITQYHSQLTFPSSTTTNKYYYKLGVIPSEMIRNNDLNNFYDIFNNPIIIQSNATTSSLTKNVTSMTIRLNFKQSIAYDVCRNLIITTQAHSSDILYIEIIGSWGSDDASQITAYGDLYCSGSKKCLSKLDIVSIDNMCRGFENKEDTAYKIWW